MIEIVNIADLVDPNDERGRTYRQINNEMTHSIPIGALVQVETGERLVVKMHTRDCDGTPLYSIGLTEYEDIGKWDHGHCEHGLTVVAPHPRLTVRLQSFPESNGKRNWTAMLVRVEKWGGLIGNCGGITIARGELWNRVAYEAERAKLLIGERDTEPCILDYGEDIETPDQWAGEVHGGRPVMERN